MHFTTFLENSHQSLSIQRESQNSPSGNVQGKSIFFGESKLKPNYGYLKQKRRPLLAKLVSRHSLIFLVENKGLGLINQLTRLYFKQKRILLKFICGVLCAVVKNCVITENSRSH